MKKIVMLLVIILLCGCEAKYELKIGDKLEENTDISIISSDLDVKYFEKLWPIMEYYTLNDIPLSITKKTDEFVPFNSLSDDIYDKKIGVADNKTFLYLSGSFSDATVPIVESSVINYTGDIDVEDNDVTKNFSFIFNSQIFEKYEMLDNISINIVDTNYNILKSNADNVNGNVYTWNITRDNYLSKPVTFMLSEKKFNIKNSISKAKNNLNNPMIRFSIFLFLIVIVLFIIYKYVLFKYKSNNNV